MSLHLNLDRVREAYKEKHPDSNLNISDFAKEFNLSHTALYNWKRGENLEKIESIHLMMKKTGLTFNQIFDK